MRRPVNAECSYPASVSHPCCRKIPPLLRRRRGSAGAWSGGGQEALELVQRLVGIGALPERVEQQRIETRERRVQVRRVRDQRPALEDQLQVVTRALGILESGRAERREARQAQRSTRRKLAIGEELAERAMHR